MIDEGEITDAKTVTALLLTNRVLMQRDMLASGHICVGHCDTSTRGRRLLTVVDSRTWPK